MGRVSASASRRFAALAQSRAMSDCLDSTRPICEETRYREGAARLRKAPAKCRSAKPPSYIPLLKWSGRFQVVASDISMLSQIDLCEIWRCAMVFVYKKWIEDIDDSARKVSTSEQEFERQGDAMPKLCGFHVPCLLLWG